jgi:hypothetical protein
MSELRHSCLLKSQEAQGVANYLFHAATEMFTLLHSNTFTAQLLKFTDKLTKENYIAICSTWDSNTNTKGDGKNVLFDAITICT